MLQRAKTRRVHVRDTERPAEGHRPSQNTTRASEMTSSHTKHHHVESRLQGPAGDQIDLGHYQKKSQSNHTKKKKVIRRGLSKETRIGRR